MRPVVLYDTTLRDGMQREGMSVSVDEKVRIAVRVADLGVHVIEGGFPGSNPKDEAFFRKLEREALGGAVVAAFGMTRGAGIVAEADAQLRVLADCWARWRLWWVRLGTFTCKRCSGSIGKRTCA